MNPPEFFEISLWVTREANPCLPLAGAIHADVVIIGSGYTRVSTAPSLSESNVVMVLLEQDLYGSGACERNDGHLTPKIDKDFPTLIKYIGKTRAVEFACFADRAVHYTEALIRKLGIECEYDPTSTPDTVFHGIDYNGHGIAQGTYAGTMLTEQMSDRRNPEVELFRHRIFSLPAEPLRWLALKGINTMLQWSDRKVDANLVQSYQ